MPTLLLIRHGRTTANASGTLAGHLPGIGLDEVGRTQAARLAERLSALPVCRVVASPLQRTAETATLLAQAHGLPVLTEVGLEECRYGAWTGRPLKDLAAEDLWQTVQRAPSAATFPPSPEHANESLAQMSARAIAAVRGHDAEVRGEHGAQAIWAAVSHGDVIKAILADALGTHLDQFQRIHVDPASVSVILYTTGRPLVLGINGTGTGLEGLIPAPIAEEAPADDTGDGIIGGGGGGAPDPAGRVEDMSSTGQVGREDVR